MTGTSLESVDLSGNLAQGLLGSQIFSPAVIIILSPRHLDIIHTSQMRVEMVAGGRWRKLTEAAGS